MRIVVFGAGSLGSAVGGLLEGAHDVTLVGRRQHVGTVMKQGLRIVGTRRKLVRLSAAEEVSAVEPPELLIIATKAYKTAEAVAVCSRWVHEEAVVLTLQNGLGNLEMLRSWKREKAFGGTTTMGAAMSRPGVVHLAGIGKTVIGSDLDSRGAKRIAKAFVEAGIPTSVEPDILGEIWAKAIVNACINPVTAALRVPNGKVLESKTISRLLVEICRECEAVAHAAGVMLPPKSMPARVRAVARATARNRSSMLQDIERGRRTEIREINGYMARMGLAHGVSVPLNNALVAIIETLEGSSL